MTKPPPGFIALEHAGARVLVRAGYERAVPLLLSPPDDAPVVGGGRAPHPVVTLPTGERAIVRAYRRGGLLRHLNRERYLLGHRAFDELRATERARGGGVRTPTAIAAAERPRAIGYTAALATLLVEGAADADAWLRAADAGEKRAALHEAGRQLAAMHAGGVAHADLNLRNLLVRESDGGPQVWILDFDRARVYGGGVPEARRARELRRLARSARKLGAPVGAAEWKALRGGYGAGWPRGAPMGRP
jgi:3-deoxy-D-manno-octulosonic acid kinase